VSAKSFERDDLIPKTPQLQNFLFPNVSTEQ
jgi:hypothetical protein